MPTFAGVNHVALTVTDLDVSERFYTEVLGFRRVLDLGYGRLCMHQRTGFVLALLRHPDEFGGRFSELTTGLDHLGFAAADRDELAAVATREVSDEEVAQLARRMLGDELPTS
jgi:catechol 2,3-dioxygenase-like lactoylglutathione lyase family enzyme